jgi:hypothetical protein
LCIRGGDRISTPKRIFWGEDKKRRGLIQVKRRIIERWKREGKGRSKKKGKERGTELEKEAAVYD